MASMFQSQPLPDGYQNKATELLTNGKMQQPSFLPQSKHIALLVACLGANELSSIRARLSR